MNEDDIVYRLAYRSERLLGLGFPWSKKDIRLHIDSIKEINILRSEIRYLQRQSMPDGEER